MRNVIGTLSLLALVLAAAPASASAPKSCVAADAKALEIQDVEQVLTRARAQEAGCEGLAQRWLIKNLRRIDLNTGVAHESQGTALRLEQQATLLGIYSEAFELFGTPELGVAADALASFLASVDRGTTDLQARADF
jgi:hypothetical protein